MGAAIKTVTHLEVLVPPSMDRSLHVDRFSELLSRLAPACPALQQLQVQGNIKRSVLAAFGAACTQLFFLKVMDRVPLDTFLDLHTALPHLSHCQLASSLQSLKRRPRSAKLGAMELLSCRLLTYIDVGPLGMSLAAWQALPSGLRSLHCLIDEEMPATFGPLICLGSLTHEWRSDDNSHLSLRNLVAILDVSPALQSLTLLCHGTRHKCRHKFWISGRCVPSTNRDLVYLHKRVVSGLTITLLHGKTAPYQGLFVSLVASKHITPDENEAQDCSLEDFLALLPHLPRLTGLRLENDSFTSVVSLTKYFATRCPTLTSLALDLKYSVRPASLVHLGCCNSLECLTLQSAKVCPASLALMCTRLVSLKALYLVGCAGFNAVEGNLLQQQLHAWGFIVAVKVS